ncbi:MAG TPA: transglutaminaseTgpA domain-containing protein, partial [Dictyoglomaceae bacterium]|nr:transglutaminaseTgpA domain-containing protein [Dictyoglomaceae bacterium]
KRKGIRFTKQKIEDSIGLRAAIFYLIIVATTSVWYFVGLSSLYVVSIIFITAIGYIFSYLQRRKNNVLLKILMTFGMIYLLRQFFIELLRNPFDPRIPLAAFLMNLNAIHSFDLPTKLDLSFSFFISFILIIIAGIFARESIFIVFLLFFMIGVIITLSYLNNYKASSKYISGVLLCVSFMGFLISPMIPKNINIGFRQDIMSQVVRRLTNLQGELRTPYSYSTSNLYRLPEGRSIPPLPFNPEEYFGFAPFVDLRQRGNLSSALVFRVLTPWGVYHRGLAFDTYNGFGWYQNEEKVQMLNTAEQPFILKKKDRARGYLERATYFVERDMPSNIIFIPKDTENLYFPSPIIYVDSQEGYRAPFEIPKELIYSSFYSSSFPSVEELLNAKVPAPNKFEDYLQLPVIPKRVIDLTLDITKDYNTSWEKLTAIKNY